MFENVENFTALQAFFRKLTSFINKILSVGTGH